MKKKRNYVTVLIFTLLLCGCGKSTIKETGDNSAGIENPVTQETTVQEVRSRIAKWCRKLWQSRSHRNCH